MSKNLEEDEIIFESPGAGKPIEIAQDFKQLSRNVRYAVYSGSLGSSPGKYKHQIIKFIALVLIFIIF